MYNSASMRGLWLEIPEHVLAERRLTGVDRWDEMWDGVLHMAPAPLYEHQRILHELEVFLAIIVRDGRGVVVPQVNVFGLATPECNYRIPDLIFVAAGREHVIARDGIRGGPDAVIEVRSPGDESYEKLPFFASLGVREVVVIDRDTKSHGSVPARGVRLRRHAGGRPGLDRVERPAGPVPALTRGPSTAGRRRRRASRTSGRHLTGRSLEGAAPSAPSVTLEGAAVEGAAPWARARDSSTYASGRNGFTSTWSNGARRNRSFRWNGTVQSKMVLQRDASARNRRAEVAATATGRADGSARRG